MISVIVTSRVEGNINHNINELVRSLAENSRQPEDIELLVKFDQDDKEAYEVQADLLNRDLPFMIKTALGPRKRGYIDIHLGYNLLMRQVSKQSNIIIAMADDFRAERDWDNALRNAAEGAGDYFIIHQRPHPVPLAGFQHPHPLRKDFDLSVNMFEGEDLYIIDEAPAWSRELLKSIEYEYGTMVFPVSFTDAWTLCLEYSLWHNHQLNITKFLPGLFVSRKTCEVDQKDNVRWDTDRKENFDFIKSEPFKKTVEWQAREISCRVRQEQTVS